MEYKNIRKFVGAKYHEIIDDLLLLSYRIRIPHKVKIMRQKEKIKVLFVISEIASWKTELLYVRMLQHVRFLPILGVSTSYGPPNVKSSVINYLRMKGYDYVDLDMNNNSINKIAPDIIFYYKPYGVCYSKGHFYNFNKKYLFCGVDYCFMTTKLVHHVKHMYYNYCWLYFAEHTDIAKRKKEVLGIWSSNVRVTGVPMQDILLQPKEMFKDPWMDNSKKKRIIYAPHHSIKGTNGDGMEFATFLEFGETILNFAKKYSDKVYFAFKPHPTLHMKLIDIWGEDRTNSYYQEWKDLPNAQIETGEYVGLFKYSDAIIHDCSSFIVEYLYMDKPGLYLVAKTNEVKNMYNYVLEGFNCYEHGKTSADIEKFIENVINEIDVKQNIRQLYKNNQLIPPRGKTACDNIIQCILEE